MIGLMLPLKVGLSWILAARFGAVGPVIGSIVVVACFELVANALYVRRRLRAGGASSGGRGRDAGRPRSSGDRHRRRVRAVTGAQRRPTPRGCSASSS